MNKVELQGKVIRIFEGRRRTIVTLFVSGYSKNFPQVVFTGADREQLAGIVEGDFVLIKGTIKTRTITENDNRYYRQFIKGLEITPAVSVFEEEFGSDVKGRHEYKNKVILSGEVVSTSNIHNVAHLIIRAPDDKFSIWLSDFSIKPEEVENEYPKGTKVYINAEVQTVKKVKDDGSAKYYENLIVNDITK